MSDVLRPFKKSPQQRNRRRSFDYLRRWIVGDLDWRNHLKRSELPRLVTDTIKEVVDQKKLSRSEKLSVTKDLIAHFQDGYESGTSYLNLLCEFGDTQTAAALIQRAKERNRSMFSAMMKATGLMMLGVTVASAILYGSFMSRTASPSVDYLPLMNKTAIEAEHADKAWLVYRDAWIKHRFCDQTIRHKTDFVNEETDEYRLMRPGDAGWGETVAWLAEREDLLQAFRKGSRLPVFGFELQFKMTDYSEEDLQAISPNFYDEMIAGELELGEPTAEEQAARMIGVLLPHSQHLRQAGRMFIVDTRLAVEQGDSERAVDNIETMLGISRQASEHPVLVCALIGHAIFGQAMQTIEELVMEHHDFLSTEQLAYLQEIVSQVDLQSYVKFDGEYAMFHDVVQQIFTDDGDGNGKMTMTGISTSTGVLKGLTTTVVAIGGSGGIPSAYSQSYDYLKTTKELFEIANMDRKATVDAYDELQAAAKAQFQKPFYEQPFALEELVEDHATENYLLGLLIPAYDAIRAASERRIGRQDAVELALAIERFRRLNQQQPDSLDQLVPDFIQQIPLCRVTGQPLKFTTRDGNVVIYSVGTDEVDNGGQPQTDDYDGNVQAFVFQDDYDGDWVLWPAPEDE